MTVPLLGLEGEQVNAQRSHKKVDASSPTSEQIDVQSEPHKALLYYQNALRRGRALKNPRAVTDALNNIGLAYYSLGEMAQALSNYEHALKIARSHKYYYLTGQILNNLGLLYSGFTPDDKISPEKALQFLIESLSLRRSVNDRSGEATTLGNLGLLYWTLRDYEKALTYEQQALSIRRQLNVPTDIALSLNNLANIYYALGDKKTAFTYLNEALEINIKHHNTLGEAATRHSLAIHKYESEKDYTFAVDNLKQAIQMYESIGDLNNKARALKDLAELHISDYERDPDNPNNIVILASDPKRVEETIGAALGYYREYLQLTDRLRALASIDELKMQLGQRTSQGYARAIAVAVSYRRYSDAFEFIERSKARTFIDQLGGLKTQVNNVRALPEAVRLRNLNRKISTALRQIQMVSVAPQTETSKVRLIHIQDQLQSYHRSWNELFSSIQLKDPHYASNASVETLTLSQVQKNLDADTTLLSYYMGEDRVICFVVTQTSFLPIYLGKASTIETLIQQFRSSLGPLDPPHPSSGVELYNRIFLPIKPFIKTHKIGLIPSGSLHYVPFAALSDGSNYLSDMYDLFYLPSASVLNFSKGSNSSSPSHLLAAAQGRAVGLGFLSFVNREVKSISNEFPSKQLLSATKSEFVHLAPNFNIIHIAALGRYSKETPLFSGVFLGDKGASGGLLTVADIYNLDLQKTSLVVLSACQTQLGERNTGDEIIGLHRAFMVAGAKAVISSLWDIDSQATTNLMTQFYKNLSHGMTKAEALSAAQKVTRGDYPQPYYWAAFMLVGNPGPLPEFQQPPSIHRDERFSLANPAYDIIDLGSFGGEPTVAYSINNAGQVVGYSRTKDTDGNTAYPFIWKDKEITKLSIVGNEDTLAGDINDAGEVVGRTFEATVPLMFKTGKLVRLQTLGGKKAIPAAINNKGVIVGGSRLNNEAITRAAVWQGQTVTALGTLGGEKSAAWDINDSGVIVGIAETRQIGPDGESTAHACLWENGQIKDLGVTLGYLNSAARVISNSGVIAGHLWNKEEEKRSFLWLHGTMTQLPDFGGKNSEVWGLNDSGDIAVGSSELYNGTSHACIWRNGIIIDLNSIIDPNDRWELEIAYSINNRGQIVGRGIHNGIYRAFILTPR